MNKKMLISLIALFIFFQPLNIKADSDSIEFNDETQKIFDVMKHLDMQGHADHDFSTCSMQQIYFDEIHELFEEGYTHQDVLDMYVAEYGQQALREPGRDGNGIVAWVTPIIGLVLGIIIVIFGLKHFTARRNNGNKQKDEKLQVSEVEANILKQTFDEERRKYF